MIMPFSRSSVSYFLYSLIDRTDAAKNVKNAVNVGGEGLAINVVHRKHRLDHAVAGGFGFDKVYYSGGGGRFCGNGSNSNGAGDTGATTGNDP